MLPGSEDIVRCALPGEADRFAELCAATPMEDVGKGRKGAVLTRPDTDGGVPLVRTTTRYARPALRFRDVHARLAAEVRERAGLPAAFDNALAERYASAYTTMGRHCDQALDLAEDTFIAVFSCYRDPDAYPRRKLVFESKERPDAGTLEIPLVHNGVVAFSVAANRRLRHRILADPAGGAGDNEWLGLTFRTSKTLLRFRDGVPYLPQGVPLTLADEARGREFYGLRRRENEETDFAYPALDRTVSASDLLPPV
ncbi:hypothetical protein AMK18_14045 [Streptomyces sp. CB01249]|uniref:hypothetical protein n=1 Tax=Streptomyces sp. CB01249 TaxID=1703929 RepID=UPI00093D1766|nr:hypothetical protein [Streptomyces sp. CB01249]OKJ02510.1 hypothetical protein AMK18_14045 [Streptomyces sp. CB01249]